ncbi:MAG TPA: NAD(P)-dependent oxidoreductase [Chitinophagaceae bacterium]|nr:NAD(P)-dependent oxidoreductase [Chitinophagaceae bacterium]
MKGRVLITGASGFVGFHLTEAAIQAGLEVFACVRASSVTDQLKEMDIRFTSIDFSDKEAIRKNFEENRYDYVIHAAGLTRAKSVEEYTEVNARYTLNLGEVATTFPLKKFVFLSSLAAIGPIQYDSEFAINEANLPQPVTEYGRSKLLAERWIANIKGLPLIILRPTAVYGPREKDIYIMFKTLNNGLEPYIGRTNQWLSFVYVKDLAAITIKALVANTERNIYVISDGKAYDRYALASLSKKILAKRTLRFHVPMGLVRLIAGTLETFATGSKPPTLSKEKLNELAAENWSCNIEKAKEELGYEPKYDLEAGLQETLSWYRENKWL